MDVITSRRMAESIHVPLASLFPGAPAIETRPASPGLTFYIETFGCQMNEHDSEKVAGVLLRRGYRKVASPDEARLVFYNTCGATIPSALISPSSRAAIRLARTAWCRIRADRNAAAPAIPFCGKCASLRRWATRRFSSWARR